MTEPLFDMDGDCFHHQPTEAERREAEYAQRQSAEWAAAGLCRGCGSAEPLSGGYCEACLDHAYGPSKM